MDNFYRGILQNEWHNEIKNYKHTKKKYPCLYDEANKYYKHEDEKKRPLTAVAEKLEIEGKAAKIIWLKNLLSKGRMNLREVDVSRAESTPVQKSQRASEEINFLSCLFPFVKLQA